jgi:phage terminase large subunit-like protein
MAVRAQTDAERNIEWIEEHCRVPEGKFVGQKIKLSREQKRWLVRIYDSPTRTFILSMARKNAKTAFCAMLLILHLVGPEARPNAQLYSAAQSRDQAAVLFELAAKMVRMSPTLSKYILIRDSAKELTCDELGTFYKALSADAATKYGLSPSFIVHDELGQVKGEKSELYEALETACAAQEKPLSVIISTQAPTDKDLLSQLIDDAMTETDPMIKVELYTTPLEDDKNGIDPFSEEAIRMANPHYDIFMNKAEVLSQARKAKRMPSQESSYRNLILNQRVEARSPFVSRALWLENTGDPIDDFAGLPVYGGLDLSAVRDLTALMLVAPVGQQFHVKSKFWLPEKGIEEKSKQDRVPYDRWAKTGHLDLCPGASIEYEFVAKYLRYIFDVCDVQQIAFDRYNMKFLMPWLVKEQFDEEELAKFIEFGQGFASMGSALREFESLLANGRMEHGDHPVLTMCAANAVVEIDAAGSKKFTKAKATGRIDGMVALAMAVSVAHTDIELDEGDLDGFLSKPIRA